MKMDTAELIASQIRKDTNTQAEVVRGIYSWVTRNISYDVEAFIGKDYSNIDERTTDTQEVIGHVLNSRKALCVGYSLLFKELCR